MDDDAIVADKIDGIPHPAETLDLIGHEETTKQVLQQYASGRMHHALLLTGPRGIGKATFALRVASHVFRHPDSANAPLSFEDTNPNDPIDGKLAARSHPNLLHMTRPWDEKAKKFKTQLTVDVIRLTVPFFGTSRGEEGWRIAIVDAADDMNASAANALLKILEEPPHNTLFFVISHSPAKVLPTIRSRCQQISMKPLLDEQVLSVLSKFGALDGLSNDDQMLLG
jgi:DNA polymerase-3 subunit delta'